MSRRLTRVDRQGAAVHHRRGLAPDLARPTAPICARWSRPRREQLELFAAADDATRRPDDRRTSRDAGRARRFRRLARRRARPRRGRRAGQRGGLAGRGRRRRPVRRRTPSPPPRRRASPCRARSSSLAKSGDLPSRPRALRLALRDAAQAARPTATRWTIAPTRWSTGSRAWPRRCAATSTRCTPSSASARSRTAQGTRFVAWFEPEHHIVRATAGFFVRRFANMRWSILTPELSIHWDGETLTEGPGRDPRRRARRAIRSRRCGRPITPASSTRRG